MVECYGGDLIECVLRCGENMVKRKAIYCLKKDEMELVEIKERLEGLVGEVREALKELGNI